MNFDRNTPYNNLPDLPPVVNLASPEIIKALLKANKLLAELKGFCHTLPDPRLLLNTLVLQESKDSSAIENIVTTQDELYRAVATTEQLSGASAATKEVLLYREALYYGLEKLQNTPVITTNLLEHV